jgi:RHS repeat-associated protein
LGSLRTEVELRSLPSFDPTSANPVQQVDLNYELTDHLGNVCSVVTGRLLDGNGGGTPKQAELVSAQGYEPFGSLLPGRNYSSDSYRFGFNGQEKDDEMHGATGTSYDFGARIYDPRVARFLSMDQCASKFPSLSAYAFASNMPTISIDIKGDSTHIFIFGAGYVNMNSRGGSHDVGRGFELNAQAAALKIMNSATFDPARDAVIVVYAPSAEKFVTALNKQYETGRVASLTVFSHGYPGGISLGGELGNDAQYNDYDLRELNSNNVSLIDKSNLESTFRANLFGCNIGNGGKSSFGQTLADYTGGVVRAFNKSSEFKTKDGDGKTVQYDGEMIRSVDRSTQTVRMTTFKSDEDPTEP